MRELLENHLKGPDSDPTYRRRVSQGMTPGEKAELFRRTGVKGDFVGVLQRFSKTPAQMFMILKKGER